MSKYDMVSTIKLKKDSVIVLKTESRLSDMASEKVLEALKRAFPDNEVLLPNGAELIIIEKE